MSEPAPAKPPGRILAFYSYKGGTGRSMALANVAWILASHGRKVLVVDWDLEAPGLHRYFAPFLDDPALKTTDGLINFVRAYALAATSSPPGEADPSGPEAAGRPPERPSWDRRRADITRFAVSLRHRFADGRGTLDFVGAGRQDTSYASQVHSFDWNNFFARLGGGDFLEAVRGRMREDYDYVLIDSRTGVSDTAGVCTVVMPDALVVCFTPNNQSIEGAAGVAASVLAQWRADPRRRGQPLEIFPMMSRVDDDEKHRLELRQGLARREFGPFLEFLPPTRREDYWGEVEMPYKAFYSYEEILAVFGDNPRRKTTILASLERLTRYLTERSEPTPIAQLASPPDEATRREILGRYGYSPESPATPAAETPEPAASAAGAQVTRPYHVFLSYRHEDRPAVFELAERLEAAGVAPWMDVREMIPGRPWLIEMERGLEVSDTCATIVGPLGLSDAQRLELESVIGRKVEESRGSFRVIPVLLPGAKRTRKSDLPLALQLATWVDFRGTLDDPEALNRLIAGIRGIPPASDRPTPLPPTPTSTAPFSPAPYTGECPYPGLEPFGEDDAPFFFGREGQVDQLLDALRSLAVSVSQCRSLLILGPSGVGKTSLVRAGLLPRLRSGAIEGSDRWPIAVMRPGSSPLDNLALALGESGVISPAELRRRFAEAGDDRAVLDRAARRIVDGLGASRLVVVVDPFEEYFTLGAASAERDTFLRNLAHAAREGDGPTLVVLAMRADFLGQAFGMPLDLVNALFDARMLVGPMSEEQLRRAIERPAQSVGLEFEKGLADLLLNDVRDQPGALPLLQFALLELWRRRSGRRLTVDAYRSIGGAAGALDHLAEDVYQRLSPPDQERCRRVFLRLVQPGEGGDDSRRAADLREFDASDRGVIEKLVEARLLVLTSGGEHGVEDTVEVVHEALIRIWPRLRDWIDNNRVELRVLRRLSDSAREWQARGRDPGFLYTGGRLAEARKLVESRAGEGLSSLEREFLLAGETRRSRWYWAFGVVTAAAALIGVSLGLGLYLAERRSFQLAARDRDAARAELGEARSGQAAALESLKQARSDAALAEQRVEDGRARLADVEARLRAAEGLRLAAQSEAAVSNMNPQLGLLLAVEAARAGGADNPALSEDFAALTRALGDAAGQSLTPRRKEPVLFLMADRGNRLVTRPGPADATNPGPAYVTPSGLGDLTAWDLGLDNPVASPLRLRGQVGRVIAAGLDATGTRLIVLADEVVSAWDLKAQSPAAVKVRSCPGVYPIAAFTPDLKRLIAVGDGGEQRWDLEPSDSEPIRFAHGGGKPVGGMAISRDGRIMASGYADGVIRLFDLTMPEMFHQDLKVHGQSVRQLAMSADGTLLASGADDGVLILWDLRASNPAASFQVLERAKSLVTALAFSPESNRLAAGNDSGKLRVWTVERGKAGLVARPSEPWQEAPGGVTALRFGADSRWLASCDAASVIRIRDATQPQSASVRRFVLDAPATKLAFSPEGRWLASAGQSARLWPLRLDDLLALARRTTGRNLTRAEWLRYFPGQPYRKTFPDLAGPDE